LCHKKEICGIKWSPNGKWLASGSNDNKLFVWDECMFYKPYCNFSKHTAAVKAIDWNPH